MSRVRCFCISSCRVRVVCCTESNAPASAIHSASALGSSTSPAKFIRECTLTAVCRRNRRPEISRLHRRTRFPLFGRPASLLATADTYAHAPTTLATARLNVRRTCGMRFTCSHDHGHDDTPARGKSGEKLKVCVVWSWVVWGVRCVVRGQTRRWASGLGNC